MPLIEIELTDDDIRHGKRGACAACPVARALGRALPSIYKKRFDTGARWLISQTSIYDGDAIQTVQTPTAVANFVKAFDNMEPVRPFKFTLVLPMDCFTVKEH